jgi:hypothetical protein
VGWSELDAFSPGGMRNRLAHFISIGREGIDEVRKMNNAVFAFTAHPRYDSFVEKIGNES